MDVSNGLNDYFYMAAAHKISMAENSHNITRKQSNYLKYYINSTKFTQLKFGEGPMTEDKKMVLNDRKETIERLLGDYVQGDDFFGQSEALPQDDFFKTMSNSIVAQFKSSRLGSDQRLYLQSYLDKTQGVYESFNGSGWTPFKKLLYLSRVRTLMLCFHRFVGTTTKKLQLQEKLKRRKDKKEAKDVREFVNEQQKLKMERNKAPHLKDEEKLKNQEEKMRVPDSLQSRRSSHTAMIDKKFEKILMRRAENDQVGLPEERANHVSDREHLGTELNIGLGINGPVDKSAPPTAAPSLPTVAEPTSSVSVGAPKPGKT